ncbi:MAG TPA: hypothetical protein VHX90_00830 [Verrucomicrobiae bacterium]|nr:hypothetical protein [Verrucomicrobiae bacterium]
MPSFKLPEDSNYNQLDGEDLFIAVKKSAFNEFNPKVLGLGDIKIASVARPAIAALFDLQGQMGFDLFAKDVPMYLNGFLNWIFAAIKKETILKEYSDGVSVYHDLPFFTKFMGDGLLVLWDTTSMSSTNQHNLIQSCKNILDAYETQFLPTMRRKVTDVPALLRCGIAKGTVLSVGNGEDYVGSCINVAARLQKLSGLQIAFARRGFDPEEAWKDLKNIKFWLLKQVSVRGIGQKELVYVLKKDFEALTTEEQKLFENP